MQDSTHVAAVRNLISTSMETTILHSAGFWNRQDALQMSVALSGVGFLPARNKYNILRSFQRNQYVQSGHALNKYREESCADSWSIMCRDPYSKLSARKQALGSS